MYAVTDFDKDETRQVSGLDLMRKGLGVRLTTRPAAALIKYRKL
jgi:hypothetical protein